MFAAAVALLFGAAAQSTPASLGAPSGDTFLADARALNDSGPGAEQSPAAQTLRNQMTAAGRALRARLAADAAAGKPALACLPPPGQLQLSLADLVLGIAALTPAQRAAPFNDAFALALASQHPCPAKS